ncbi:MULTISPECIES: hypothetical protein [Burkholderia]|uniref:Uncharacterized protein n=1 Tax=Burkholderia orbicola (strain MC0-3) TaxID=406425 RepID=B1KCI6_BURO0|nr:MULTISPECIES: hypothetical protein [Burkholderia]ACA95933.1 hypothetical protein Bcenmc03_6829 [Burkholderia orbicola MC0-3]MBY4798426.1 hypothetical protein [Burkholderia cepacia]MCA8088011.1 hypothetical protein [Burkholderia cenocepacia]
MTRSTKDGFAIEVLPARRSTHVSFALTPSSLPAKQRVSPMHALPQTHHDVARPLPPHVERPGDQHRRHFD